MSKEMNSYRKTAIIVGILFLTSTVAFSMGSSFIKSYFNVGNLDKTPLINGVLLEIYCGIAVAGIGILMFPILRKFNKVLALGYTVFRIIECVTIIIGGIYLLSLLKLMWNYESIIFTFTGLGGLIFSYLLYQSKLIPRYLSVLGIIGYAILLPGVLLNMWGYVDLNTSTGMFLYLPGGLFEIFLPLWFFVKGFNPSAIASKSEKLLIVRK
jgi:hypothetical protein